MKTSLALAAVAAVLGLAAAPAAAALEDAGIAGHGHMRRHHAARSTIQNIEKRYQGHGTFYNTQTGNAGSCGRYLKNSEYVVAVAGGIMNSGLCGKTVTITANGKTAQATIEDTCPPGGGNCGGADLDMSPSLFAFFAPMSVGKMPISWHVGGGGGGGGGNNNNDDGDDDNEDDDDDDDGAAAAAAAAAAKKAAARASAAAASAAAEASASRSSASVASESRASVASVASESRASVASESRASRASVASESRASVASVASVSKASVAAAEASAAAEAQRPKVIENYVAVFEGMNNMVAAAQS